MDLPELPDIVVPIEFESLVDGKLLLKTPTGGLAGVIGDLDEEKVEVIKKATLLAIYYK